MKRVIEDSALQIVVLQPDRESGVEGGQPKGAESQTHNDGEFRMKMLIATAALATMIVSPALAQSTRQAAEPSPYMAYGQTWQAPGQAFAQQPYVAFPRLPRSASPNFDVYDTRGRYVGSDPDPAIRGQLLRDPPGVDD
jgi:hypothetical protein